MPSSLAGPEWPQDCGSSAALHAGGPYGLPDFMYFDAYPPPPTHDAATTGFDLSGRGFEGLETATGDPSSSSTVSAWISPPASSDEGPDMQQQQQQPPSTFLQAFGSGASVVTPPLGPISSSSSGHAPATPPEAADYMTTTTTTATAAAFPPFPAPNGLGLVYPHHPHPQQHHHHHHHHDAVLDPALFDDAAAVADLPLLPPTPPTPSHSLDPQHASLLHMAVASGNVEVLRMILDRVPPALARRPDADGCTPAQRAARAGRPDMLAVLNHSTATHSPTTTTTTGTGTDTSGDGGVSLGFESMC